MISMSCTKTNVNQFWHDVVSIARRCGNLVIRIMVTRLVRQSLWRSELFRIADLLMQAEKYRLSVFRSGFQNSSKMVNRDQTKVYFYFY